jgi:hypothetical protein
LGKIYNRRQFIWEVQRIRALRVQRRQGELQAGMSGEMGKKGSGRTELVFNLWAALRMLSSD